MWPLELWLWTVKSKNRGSITFLWYQQSHNFDRRSLFISYSQSVMFSFDHDPVPSLTLTKYFFVPKPNLIIGVEAQKTVIWNIFSNNHMLFHKHYEMMSLTLPYFYPCFECMSFKQTASAAVFLKMLLFT